MHPTIVKLIDHSAFRYLFIGGVTFLIELAALYVLTEVFNNTTTTAVSISFAIGLIASFVLQKYIAFKDTSHTKKRFIWQSVLYGALVAFNYIFTVYFVSAFEDMFGIYIARTIALAITTVWNYFIYSRLIFSSRPSE